MLETQQLLWLTVPWTCLPFIQTPEHWCQLLINLMDTPGLAFCSRDLFVAVLWNKSIWLYKIAVELQYLGIKVQFAIFSHADFLGSSI